MRRPGRATLSISNRGARHEQSSRLLRNVHAHHQGEQR
ncbi:hypothetical protein RHECNPAF_1330075 [Rhizobium etli CNPAF512]|nr:hypothetical protein RHECNPAF_1330075 [Rhizobium etli CNPAF512]